MDTGFLSVASIWFQWVMPMPLAAGPIRTWPVLSARPSSPLSATVTRRDRSCRGAWSDGCQHLHTVPLALIPPVLPVLISPVAIPYVYAFPYIPTRLIHIPLRPPHIVENYICTSSSHTAIAFMYTSIPYLYTTLLPPHPLNTYMQPPTHTSTPHTHAFAHMSHVPISPSSHTLCITQYPNTYPSPCIIHTQKSYMLIPTCSAILCMCPSPIPPHPTDAYAQPQLLRLSFHPRKSLLDPQGFVVPKE